MTREEIKNIIIENIFKINEDDIFESCIVNEESMVRENMVSSENSLKSESLYHWNLSSLKIIELIINLENEFDIEINTDDIVEFITIGDLITIIQKIIG